MTDLIKLTLSSLFLLMILSCKDNVNKPDTAQNQSKSEDGLWLSYSKEATVFKLWSPHADKVQLNLFKKGNGGEAYAMKIY